MSMEFLVTIEWNTPDRSFTECYFVEADNYDHAKWLGEQYADENEGGEVSGVLPIDRGHENMVQNIMGHIGYLDFKPDQSYDCGGDSDDGVCDKCMICMDEGLMGTIHEGEWTDIIETCAHCEQVRE